MTQSEQKKKKMDQTGRKKGVKEKRKSDTNYTKRDRRMKQRVKKG